MKKVLLIVLLMTFTVLTACTNEQDGSLSPEELFNNAVGNLDEADSVTIEQVAEFNFNVSGEEAFTKLYVKGDIIQEPYYEFLTIEASDNTTGSVITKEMKTFVDGQFYLFTDYSNVYYANEADYDIYSSNEEESELSILLKYAPVEVYNVVEEENQVQYMIKTNLDSLASEDQVLFNNLLDYFIGYDAYNIEDLKTIEFEEIIIIDKETQQLVEFNLVISDLMEQAYDASGATIDISDVQSYFNIKFSNYNDVEKKQNIIDNANYDDAPDFYLDYLKYEELQLDIPLSLTLDEAYDYDIVKLNVPQGNAYTFEIDADYLVGADIYTQETLELFDNGISDEGIPVGNSIQLEPGEYYLMVYNMSEDVVYATDVIENPFTITMRLTSQTTTL